MSVCARANDCLHVCVCVCNGAEGLKQRQCRCQARSLSLAFRQSTPLVCCLTAILVVSRPPHFDSYHSSHILCCVSRCHSFVLSCPDITRLRFHRLWWWNYTIKVLCVNVDTIESSILISQWKRLTVSSSAQRGQPKFWEAMHRLVIALFYSFSEIFILPPPCFFDEQNWQWGLLLCNDGVGNGRWQCVISVWYSFVCP